MSDKHNLEWNKIFASVLVAGIVAGLAGFAAKTLVHPHELEKPAIEVDTSALEAATSGGPAAPTGPEPVLALLAKADVAKGQALAKACLACHDFSKGGPNKIGPNLWGIVNNKKAHAEGFAYSDVIKGMSEKGDHWTYQNLNGFLWKPQVYAKGTKMTYPGLKKPDDRASVIAYLRTLADSPAALPSDADIAGEQTKDTAPASEKPADSKPGDAAPNNNVKKEQSSPQDAANPKTGELNAGVSRSAQPTAPQKTGAPSGDSQAEAADKAVDVKP